MKRRKHAAPCPRCLELAREGKLRTEAVQPLPEGALAPIGLNRQRCCYDCASADTVVKLRIVPTFEMARIATGNDRQEQYRFPGAPLGLVGAGLLRPSVPGDFTEHLAWLDASEWFGLDGQWEAT
jgi:hypothetical protein